MADAQGDGRGTTWRLFARHSDAPPDLVQFSSHTPLAPLISPPSTSSGFDPSPNFDMLVPGKLIRRLTHRPKSSKKGSGNALPPTSEAEEDGVPANSAAFPNPEISPGCIPPPDTVRSLQAAPNCCSIVEDELVGEADNGLADTTLVQDTSHDHEPSRALASPQAFWSAAHFHNRFQSPPAASAVDPIPTSEEPKAICCSPSPPEDERAAVPTTDDSEFALSGSVARQTSGSPATNAEDDIVTDSMDQVGVALTWTDETHSFETSQSRVSASVSSAAPRLAYPSLRHSIRSSHRTSTGFVATSDGSWAVAGSGPAILEPPFKSAVPEPAPSQPPPSELGIDSTSCLNNASESSSEDIEADMVLVRALPAPPVRLGNGSLSASTSPQGSPPVLQTDSPAPEDIFCCSPRAQPVTRKNHESPRLIDAAKLRSILQREKERELEAAAIKEGQELDQQKIQDEASLWARVMTETVLRPAATDGHSGQNVPRDGRDKTKVFEQDAQPSVSAADYASDLPWSVNGHAETGRHGSFVPKMSPRSSPEDSVGGLERVVVQAKGTDREKESSEESLPEAVRNKVFRGKAKVFEATRVRLEQGTAVLEREAVGSPTSAGPGQIHNCRETVSIPSRAVSYSSHTSNTSRRSGAALQPSRHSRTVSTVSSGPRADPVGRGQGLDTTLGDLLRFPGSPSPERSRHNPEQETASDANESAKELDVLTLDPVLRKALQGGFKPKVHPSTVAGSRTSSGRVLSPSMSSHSYRSLGRASRSPCAYTGPCSPAQSDVSLSQVAEDIAKGPPLRAKVDAHMLMGPAAGDQHRSRRNSARSISSLPVSSADGGSLASSIGPSGRVDGVLGRQHAPLPSWTNAMGTMSVGIGARWALPSHAPFTKGAVKSRVATNLPSLGKPATFTLSTRPRAASASVAHEHMQPKRALDVLSVEPTSSVGASATTAPPLLRTAQQTVSSAPPPGQT